MRRGSFLHLGYWVLFAQGGLLAAVLLPVHIVFQGILGPFGVVKVATPSDLSLLGNPIVKLYLLVLIAAPFYHFAHRLRYLLVDVGVHAAKSVPAQVIFYGGAVVITLVTIVVLLTSAPISFG